eukprot:COSAG05_NODE_38_length_27626_cov_78.614306_5_plen_82_part_00
MTKCLGYFFFFFFFFFFFVVDHYSVLGVAVMDHSANELKRAYKKSSMKHHPDRQGGSTKAFQLVATAHTVLADPVTVQDCR